MPESIFLTCIIIIFIYGLVFIFKKRAQYNRTLNTIFLKVTLPKKESDLDNKKETTKDFKEMVSLMEQLLASLKSTYSIKIMKRMEKYIFM